MATGADASPHPRAIAIIKVRAVAESVGWYRRVGFEVRGDEPDGDATFAEVGRDGFVLQLLSGDTPWSGPPTFTGSFYVHVADVRAVLEVVRERVAVEWGVEERPWGALELTLRDPDGYFVTFTQAAP
jgi:hypothetical protein